MLRKEVVQRAEETTSLRREAISLRKEVASQRTQMMDSLKDMNGSFLVPRVDVGIMMNANDMIEWIIK